MPLFLNLPTTAHIKIKNPYPEKKKRAPILAPPTHLRPRRLVQAQARGCERASQGAFDFLSLACARTPGANHNLASSPVRPPRLLVPLPPPRSRRRLKQREEGLRVKPAAAALDGFGSVDLQGQGGPAPRRARAPVPLRIRETFYPLGPGSLVPPLEFCSPRAISIAGTLGRACVCAGVLGFLVVEVDERERLALLPVVDWIGAKRVLVVDMFVPVCNRGCFHWLSR
jgi:hypothetical protein